MPLLYTGLIKHKSGTFKYNIRWYSLKIKVIYIIGAIFIILSPVHSKQKKLLVHWLGNCDWLTYRIANGFPLQEGRLPSCYSLTTSVSSDFCMQLACACHVCTYCTFALFAFTTFPGPSINDSLSTSKRAIQLSMMRCTEKKSTSIPKSIVWLSHRLPAS